MVFCTHLMKYPFILHYIILVVICVLFVQLLIDLEESIFDLKTYFDFKGRLPIYLFPVNLNTLVEKLSKICFSSAKIKLRIS